MDEEGTCIMYKKNDPIIFRFLDVDYIQRHQARFGPTYHSIHLKDGKTIDITELIEGFDNQIKAFRDSYPDKYEEYDRGLGVHLHIHR